MYKKYKFPSYFGFGKLDQKSIIENTYGVSADYIFEEKSVHKISYNPMDKEWKIEDIFYESGMITYSKNLMKAGLMHLGYLNREPSSTFDFFKKTFFSRGNVYFEDFDKWRNEKRIVSYFPAGRIFILRVPLYLDQDFRAKGDFLFKNNIPSLEGENSSEIKLCDLYNTTLMFHENNKVNFIPILMFEYFIPMALLLDAVDWISGNNILANDKKYQMIIQDVNSKVDSDVQTFNQEPYGGTSTSYAIITKGLNDTQSYFGKFEKKIVEKLKAKSSVFNYDF